MNRTEKIKLIRKQLWTLGYKVRDVSNALTYYDLVVNGKIRLAVLPLKNSLEAKNMNGKSCDVFARIEQGKKEYALSVENEVRLKWKNPVAIFGPKSQVNYKVEKKNTIKTNE